MKRLDTGVNVRGIGGEMMGKAGVEILIPSSDMAVVGFTEVLPRLRSIIRARLRLRYLLKNDCPDLLILIDYPDFNINLAGFAKRYGVPVLYYISPQVWAWRRGRIKKISRRVDRMAVILPFEKEIYGKRGMNVEYVGHPLLDSIPTNIDKDEMIREMGLEGSHPILGLLPGSRSEEIRNLLPIMVESAEILSSHYNNLRCVLQLASTISPDLVQSEISKSTLEITVSGKDIYRTLSVCDMAFVASGTATLETAIMTVPMIIVYKVSPVSFWICKMALRVPYIGLANLVAGEEVAPELIQGEVTAQRLAREALSILKNEQRKKDMIDRLELLRHKLGSGGASERTARIALEMMEGGD